MRDLLVQLPRPRYLHSFAGIATYHTGIQACSSNGMGSPINCLTKAEKIFLNMEEYLKARFMIS